MKHVVAQLEREEQRTGREHVAVMGKEGRTSVVERRVNLTVPYAYIFGENVDRVLQDHKLGATTFRVLFRVLALVSRGDVVAISQTGVAGDLGMSKQQVHKAWRELREAQILLLDESGHEYLNVNLFYRGSPKDLMAGAGGKRLEQSSQLEGVKPVVKT
jgi:transposase-like protein